MPLISECYTGYLLAQKARNVSPSYVSLLDYTRSYWLRRHGDCPISEITPEMIREYLAWLADGDESRVPSPEMASPSVYIHYRNLKAFLHWCVDEGHLDVSPMAKVKKPRVEERLPDVLTEQEVSLLLRRTKESGCPQAFRDYCILLMFLDTGLRLEELSSLDLRDVNLTQGYVKVLGKGRRERIVPMGIKLRRDLHRYQLSHRCAVEGETALFTNDEGFRFEKQGIRMVVLRHLKEHVDRTLTKYGPHTLRHTAITIDLRETGDIQRVSRKAGHRSLETTQRYTHLADSDLLWGDAGSPMDRVVTHK
jgi:site-specific recombinase XerD